MSYVYQYLNFAFSVLLLSITQSLNANRSTFGRVIDLFDDPQLIATVIYNTEPSLGTAMNTEGRFHVCHDPSADSQIHTSKTDLKNRALTADLDLLGDIVTDICYINKN